MLNFPILCDLFPFPMFYCANEGKMFKNLIILKESTLLDVMRPYDMLRILIFPFAHNHNSMRHTTAHPQSSTCA